jgi:hypothetical protein
MMRSELIKFDGLDGAIVGVGTRIGSADFLIYSRARCIEILMADNDWTEEEAEEWFEYNVQGAYVGEAIPAFMEEYEEEEE